MTSRGVAGGHTLPPNPEFLEFERTDGDAKQWPTNTKEVVDGDGQVNYMKPLGPEDSSDIHWRCREAEKTMYVSHPFVTPRAEDTGSSDC
jgi:hypothetical protein